MERRAVCRLYGLTGDEVKVMMERRLGQRLPGRHGGIGMGIDKIVYAVYGLTEDEVKVIEPDFPLSEAEYEGIGEMK
ncbi:MAG: hypothetical protein LBT04_03365 [Prevotellaceae bacterium]|nr:hypothetical protein [Prevotellaceae bacterium]